MSYVLIGGKRYYKDDRTGKVSLDNVSQAEAERRAQGSLVVHQNQYAGRTAGNRPKSVTGTRSIGGKPWIPIIIGAALLAIVCAFSYNRSHTSSTAAMISDYMEANQNSSNNAEEDLDQQTRMKRDEASGYVMPYSASRYLEAADIEGRSDKEIQLIINEIYARHGREFYLQEYSEYFNAQDWYEPIYGKTDEEIVEEFNEFERENVNLLSGYL